MNVELWIRESRLDREEIGIPRDILRLLEEVGLIEDGGLLRVSRPQRREICTHLTRLIANEVHERELLSNREVWLPILKKLHPGDYSKGNRHLYSILDYLIKHQDENLEEMLGSSVSVVQDYECSRSISRVS